MRLPSRWICGVLACWIAGSTFGDSPPASIAAGRRDSVADLRSFGLSFTAPEGWVRGGEVAFNELAVFSNVTGNKLVAMLRVTAGTEKGSTLQAFAAKLATQGGNTMRPAIAGPPSKGCIEFQPGPISGLPATAAAVMAVGDNFAVFLVGGPDANSAWQTLRSITASAVVSPPIPAADDLTLRRKEVPVFPRKGLLISLPEPYRPEKVNDPGKEAFFGVRDWASGKDQALIQITAYPSPRDTNLDTFAEVEARAMTARFRLADPVQMTKTSNAMPTYISTVFSTKAGISERLVTTRLDESHLVNFLFRSHAPDASVRDRYMAVAEEIANSLRISKDYADSYQTSVNPVRASPTASGSPSTKPVDHPEDETGAFYVETDLVGGNGGGNFSVASKNAKLITALRYTPGKWGKDSVVRQIEPIFEDQDMTAQPAKNAIAINARKGYVLGGITVDYDDTNVLAFKVIFCRVKDGLPDAQDFYASNWYGTPLNRRPQRSIGGHGERVVGICGRQGLNLAAIGLITEGSARRTARVGGNGGNPFSHLGYTGAQVIGFRWRTGNWDRPVLAEFDPVFSTGAQVDARPGQQETMAKPGYVVGGVIADTDDTNTVAVKIIFMRLSGDKPDPTDSYISDWIGTPCNIRQLQLAGHGERVVGTFGRKGMNMDGFGLLVRDEATAHVANKPTTRAKR